MTTIGGTPIVLKDVLITFATDEYSTLISSAAFTPSSSIVTFKGLKPGATFTDVTSASWTLDLTFAQDWTTANSMSKYLFANEGLSKVVTLKPTSAGAATFTATVMITPGAVGGAVDSTAVATVSLGVQGKPVLT